MASREAIRHESLKDFMRQVLNTLGIGLVAPLLYIGVYLAGFAQASIHTSCMNLLFTSDDLSKFVRRFFIAFRRMLL